MLCGFRLNTSVSGLTSLLRASRWSSNEFLQFTCLHRSHAVLALISSALQKLHKCVTENTTERGVYLLIEHCGLITELVPRLQRWRGRGSSRAGVAAVTVRQQWRRLSPNFS